MKTVCFAAAAAFGILTGAAHAASVTFSFSGLDNQFNAGLPGRGPITGSITYDTSAASFVNGSLFTGAFADIDININGVTVKSDASCVDVSCNTINQVTIGGPQDAFNSVYSGPFDATGQSYGIQSVSLEIRTDPGSLFSVQNQLFNELTPGETIDLSGDYISLVVEYDDGLFSTSSIARSDDLTSVSVSVSGDSMTPVPLPAGLPLLLAGLGAFAYVRRRQS